MRKLLSSFLLLALVGLGACSIDSSGEPVAKDPFVPTQGPAPYKPTPAPPTNKRVVLLHTNDEHSHLLGYAPFSEYPFLPEADGTVNVGKIAAKIGHDTKTVGGIVRRQHLVNKIRATSADPVLLLSAGDATMGTVFHLATAQAAPDWVAMGALGYDFATFGNHEFDWGPDTLSASLRTAHRTLFGGAVPIIASNTFFDDVTAGGSGSDLQALMGPGNSGAPIMPWATKTLANGLKVGFLGLIGYEAQLVAGGKGPIAFSVPKTGAACTSSAQCAAGESCTRKFCVNPLDATAHLAAVASDAQPIVDLLRNQEKVDLVVALSHLGAGEDTALASFTNGIDVIIGGHSHDQVTPTKVGQTIIVQAGSYGSILGQVTIAVTPEKKISLEDAGTMLHEIDGALDAEIFEGTNLTATPPVLSESFETALGLTGGIIGPVLAALNRGLAATLEGILDPTHQTAGEPTLLDAPFSSDHDIVGEALSKDTNLSHLVTDAELATVMQGACLNPATETIIAVQGNGVIRESLRFDSTGHTTIADVFGVMPLGASPWDSGQRAPGFPIVLFRLRPIDLFVAADIGVGKGLVSDSFFLSYAGMRVSFNRDFDSFDQTTFNPMGTEPGGRITKIEVDTNPLPTGETWSTIYEYNAATPWAARWTGVHPLNGKLTIITNLYLASFLNAFGLKPLASDGDDACVDGTTCDSGVCTDDKCKAELVLPQTVMCFTMDAMTGTFDCAEGKPAMKRCIDLPGSTLAPSPSWQFPEVKEWIALLNYLNALPNKTIPAPMYSGALPASPRVVEVTPAK